MTYFQKRITSVFTFIGDTPIRRPVRPTGPVEKDGPRINEFIRNREVMLIDQDGVKRGVTPIREALAIAEEAGLDLVEVSPNPELPVCKILDYGKYRFEQQKKAAEARRNQKIIEIKEIKLRPGIDDHDYVVKMKAVQRFLEDGDKVKITLKFRGREMAHMDLGAKVILRVKADTAAYAKVEQEVKLEGKQMMMVLAPK